MSSEAVVERVSRHFVPVAVDRLRIGESQGAGADLWHGIQRQRKAFQGIWIVSPEGRVLASQSGSSDGNVDPWTKEVIRAMDTGLKEFGAVKPRTTINVNPFPPRGVGEEPDGSIRLALYCSLLREGRREERVATEALSLTAEDLRALVPDRIEEQAERTVPESVARKFCRALSPYSEPTIVPRPEHLKLARLKAKVDSTSGGQAHLRLTGAWESELVGGETPGVISASVTAQGLAVYDLEQKRFRSLLLVFDGLYRHHGDGPQPMGAVVEWVARN